MRAIDVETHVRNVGEVDAVDFGLSRCCRNTTRCARISRIVVNFAYNSATAIGGEERRIRDSVVAIGPVTDQAEIDFRNVCRQYGELNCRFPD